MTMLQGSLYRIITRSGNKFTVELDRGCEIYSAHFPGHPITPGVAIVQIAVELLSLVSGRTLDISYAKNIKFLVPIIPEEGTLLDYCIDSDSVINVYMQDQLCTTMNIITE